MRRVALSLAVLALLGAAAGCGAEGTTRALPQTVVGTLPKAPQQAAIPPGDPATGKTLFASQGCGGCHTYKPAGSGGKVGPDLGHLAADAKKANQGSLQQYTFDSIKNPSAYIVPGFQPVMPDFASLGDKKIADLVAFLTKP
jgi:mono/diheme cytochrome c family protein